MRPSAADANKLVWPLAAALGLAIGVGTSFGQTYLTSTTLNALVNSASPWLVAPLVVGTLLPRGRAAAAAAAGLVTCLLQLVGYDLCSVVRGYAVSTSVDAFWALCAVIGGPLFGLAGHTWRHAGPDTRGIGPAALAGAFIGEGIWSRLHTLHEIGAGLLFIAIGAAIALAGLRGWRGGRWLALTVPLAIVAELALTHVYR